MLESLRKYRASLDAFRKRLGRLAAQHVNVAADKEEALRLVDEYFRTIREQLRLLGFTPERLGTLDTSMQQLLELSHRRSPREAYKSLLSSISRHLLDTEKEALTLPMRPGANSTVDPLDAKILATLSNLLPSAARSYEQALSDLVGPDRLSWRGPATDLREALRETLDHLAPDKDVTSQAGFKLEKDTTGPTMKQKVRFVLRHRGLGNSATAPPEAAAEAIEEVVGSFVRSVYTRSSVSTHTPTDRREVLRVRDWVRVTLAELLSLGS